MVRDAVRQVLENSGITGEEPLVVGVSGGVDSMVLLHVLHTLGQPLVVAHVNYHKRGAESDADEILVRQSSGLMGVPCHSRSAHYKHGDGNFQEWARQMRYQFFEELRQETGATAIATAHQKDDQVETILMKLMRGAGPLSWAGMQYWDGTYLRPLLDVTRSEIEQYAREQEVPYREDASNLESDYARNFLRNEWTPELNERLPGWQQNILRLREWSIQTEEALETIAKQLRNDDGSWDLNQFCHLSNGLQQALIRYWLKKNQPGEVLISHGNLGEVSNICHLQSGQFVTVGSEIHLWRDRDRLVFEGRKESLNEKEIKLSKEDLAQNKRVIGFARFSLSNEYPREYGKKLYCRLKEFDWPITVRNWKDGDRFQPLGMEGRQLVSDFLTNRKIPSNRKKEALVVVSFDQKICAVIFPPSSTVSRKGSGEGGPQRTSIDSRYPDDSTKRVGFGHRHRLLPTAGIGQSPPHHEPGGIAESVRCPDEPAEVLTIEPII